MSSKKFLRRAFSWVMKVLVYLFLGIPTALHYWYLRCILATQIRRLDGKKLEQTNDGSSSADKPTLNMATGLEVLDFKLHRSKTYIDQITFGKLSEVATLAGGKQTVPLVSNFILRHVLFNSMFSYGLVEESNPKSEIAWHFSFNKIGRYAILRKFSWDVAKILVLKSGRLKIVDSSGKIHTQYCKSWPLAKAHAQVQLTQLAPGMIHNLDHVFLSSVIACESRKNLPEGSTLRRLLEAHTRFSRVINNVELNDILCSIEKRNGSHGFMRPWMNGPVDKEYATTQLQRKCEILYYKNSSMIPDLNDDIPYQSFIKDYYGIFRNFVTELSPRLKSDYELLRKGIGQHLPGVAKHDMVDVLSAFLWNSSIVHTSDHETYLKQWGRRYGCMAIKKRLVKSTKADNNVNISTVSDGKIAHITLQETATKKVTAKDVAINIESRRFANENGLNFFRAIDVFRTKCFLRTYIQYNPTPCLDMALCNTNYGFTDPEAVEAADNFLTNIQDFSSMLKQRGEAIVRGHDFIRSVCF